MSLATHLPWPAHRRRRRAPDQRARRSGRAPWRVAHPHHLRPPVGGASQLLLLRHHLVLAPRLLEARARRRRRRRAAHHAHGGAAAAELARHGQARAVGLRAHRHGVHVWLRVLGCPLLGKGEQVRVRRAQRGGGAGAAAQPAGGRARRVQRRRLRGVGVHPCLAHAGGRVTLVLGGELARLLSTARVQGGGRVGCAGRRVARGKGREGGLGSVRCDVAMPKRGAERQAHLAAARRLGAAKAQQPGALGLLLVLLLPQAPGSLGALGADELLRLRTVPTRW